MKMLDYKRCVPLTFLIVIFIACANMVAFAFDVAEVKVYGVAIKGYDPVAYFTENRAVKGSKEFTYDWNEARWQFSNAEHRDLFAANPQKYAPHHGGFGAESLLAGKVADENPEEWKIIDGKLYLGWENHKQKGSVDRLAEKFHISVKKIDDTLYPAGPDETVRARMAYQTKSEGSP